MSSVKKNEIRNIMLFSEKIRALREASKITQTTMAKALCISVPMYSRIEKGERSVKKEQILRIAKVLDTDADNLRKLWLADQVSAVLDGEDDVFNEVVNIAKKDCKKPKKPQDKYTFIDLFAGCGGLSEGFLQTGRFDALAHVEWEFPMVDTLRNRLVQKWNYTSEQAKKEVICFDIQKTDELLNGNWSEDSKEKYAKYNAPSIVNGGLNSLIRKRPVDLIIGGPPCQAYSIHGRATDKNSMKDDYRNYLFESFCKIVDAYRPQMFVFENVKGLLSARPGGVYVKERIFSAFDKIGYDIVLPSKMSSIVFDANDYNVPQVRPRIIILGVKRGAGLQLSELYESIEAQKCGYHLTVRDGIGKLPPLYPLKEVIKNGRSLISHSSCPIPSITLHESRHHSERDRRVFREWINNNMNHVSHQKMIDFYYKITGHRTLFQKYKSLEWDKPSHTIVAHLSKDGYMFIHPDVKQERSITVREAACLQSFPIDYQFLGSRPYNYKMIGNAVPVEFAKRIALGLCNILDKRL